MTTKVIFNIDKNVKAKAQRKARKQGMTLSSVLNFATRAYVNDSLEIDIIARDLAEARKEIREGKLIPEEEVYRGLGIKIKR